MFRFGNLELNLHLSPLHPRWTICGLSLSVLLRCLEKRFKNKKISQMVFFLQKVTNPSLKSPKWQGGICRICPVGGVGGSTWWSFCRELSTERNQKTQLKRWPGPKWLFPQTDIRIIVQLIISIFRTKLAVSFRDSVFKGRSFERNPCRQRGDFIWWLFSFFLSCLTFVKVFMENYQHLFLSDCLPPRFSKSIILNEWVWISTWMSQQMSKWFVSGLLYPQYTSCITRL